MAKNEVRERMLQDGPRALSDGDLLSVLGADWVASRSVGELAWLTVAELRRLGLGEVRATGLAAAFELGRRGAWAPPRRGERCLDPGRVSELMRAVAHAPVEEFHVVLLDVRGRLLRSERVALGSVSQCPVSPRDVLRVALREGAHGVVFVHNHPSGVMCRAPIWRAMPGMTGGPGGPGQDEEHNGAGRIAPSETMGGHGASAWSMASPSAPPDLSGGEGSSDDSHELAVQVVTESSVEGCGVGRWPASRKRWPRDAKLDPCRDSVPEVWLAHRPRCFHRGAPRLPGRAGGRRP